MATNSREANTNYSVYIGSNKYGAGKRLSIESQEHLSFTRHTTLTGNNPIHDIALLKLSEAIKFSEFQGSVRPIELADQDQERTWATPGSMAYVASFGRYPLDPKDRTNQSKISDEVSEVLREVVVPIQPTSKCKANYGPEHIFTDGMICAGFDEGGPDTCQGWTGAALVVPVGRDNDKKMVQIGLPSWGRGCGQPKYFGVNTRVATYRDWIYQTIDRVNRRAERANSDTDRTTSAEAPSQPEFAYAPPGALHPSSSRRGRVNDRRVYAPGIIFPLALRSGENPHMNSQIFGFGGGGWEGRGQAGGTECNAQNYDPFGQRDTFCEEGGWALPMCPAGNGNPGQAIRPPTCIDSRWDVVAVTNGTITKVTQDTLVVLKGNDGTTYWYKHLNPRTIRVRSGQRVSQGQVLGKVSRYAGGSGATTTHLMFQARQTIRAGSRRLRTWVPIYTSLIAALRRAKGLGQSVNDNGNLIVDALYEVGAVAAGSQASSGPASKGALAARAKVDWQDEAIKRDAGSASGNAESSVSAVDARIAALKLPVLGLDIEEFTRQLGTKLPASRTNLVMDANNPVWYQLEHSFGDDWRIAIEADLRINHVLPAGALTGPQASSISFSGGWDGIMGATVYRFGGVPYVITVHCGTSNCASRLRPGRLLRIISAKPPQVPETGGAPDSTR